MLIIWFENQFKINLNEPKHEINNQLVNKIGNQLSASPI